MNSVAKLLVGLAFVASSCSEKVEQVVPARDIIFNSTVVMGYSEGRQEEHEALMKDLGVEFRVFGAGYKETVPNIAYFKSAEYSAIAATTASLADGAYSSLSFCGGSYKGDKITFKPTDEYKSMCASLDLFHVGDNKSTVKDIELTARTGRVCLQVAEIPETCAKIVLRAYKLPTTLTVQKEVSETAELVAGDLIDLTMERVHDKSMLLAGYRPFYISALCDGESKYIEVDLYTKNNTLLRTHRTEVRFNNAWTWTQGLDNSNAK